MKKCILISIFNFIIFQESYSFRCFLLHCVSVCISVCARVNCYLWLIGVPNFLLFFSFFLLVFASSHFQKYFSLYICSQIQKFNHRTYQYNSDLHTKIRCTFVVCKLHLHIFSNIRIYKCTPSFIVYYYA